MVYKYLLCVLVLFSSAVSANTPQVLFEKIESWITPLDVPFNSKADAEGSVRYLLYEHQVDLSAQQKKQFFHFATQPLTEQGLSKIPQVEVKFSPIYEELVFHTIQVHRNGERINKLDKSNLKVFQQEDQLKENLYSENWSALFILEDIRVGDIIEYSYSIRGSNPVLGEKSFGSSALSWGVPVEQTHFRLISKASEKVFIDVHNSDNQVSKKTIADTTEYVLSQHNVEAVREDDYAPQWFTPYAYLTYSQYDSWQGVNDWATELYDIDLTLPVELIEIIEQHKSADSLTSATKMLQWVQDNIRYFGIEMGVNSHMPSSPSETFNRRYGDCKDKAILLIAVLKHFNIDAHPVLVSTSTSKLLPDETPSPGAFNHVIVTFDIGDKQYWVDATMSNQRGSLDEMSFPNLYWGLVIKGNTKDLTAIEPSNVAQLRDSISVRQTLTLGKNLAQNEFALETTYKGWQAERIRNYIDDVGVQVSSKDHLDYLAKYFPGIKLGQPLIVENGKTDNTVTIRESYLIDKFDKASRSNNKLFLQPYQILDNVWLPNIRQRNAPFVLPHFLDIDVEIQVQAEDAKDIIWFDDSAVKVNDNKWFNFERNVEKKGKNIAVSYQYASLLETVSAEEFRQYANLLEDIENGLAFSLILRNDSAVNNNARAKSLINKLMNKNK